MTLSSNLPFLPPEISCFLMISHLMKSVEYKMQSCTGREGDSVCSWLKHCRRKMLIVKGEEREFFRLPILFFNLDLIDYEGVVNLISLFTLTTAIHNC